MREIVRRPNTHGKAMACWIARSAAGSWKRRPPSALKEGVKLLNQHLLPSFESKDILIGAHETVATIDLLGESRNDRLTFKLKTVQFFYAFDDLRDVKRLAGTPEYVMHHIDLRRTFTRSLSLARTERKRRTALSWASSETSMHASEYSSFDFIFFHGSILPAAQAAVFTGEDTITEYVCQ